MWIFKLSLGVCSTELHSLVSSPGYLVSNGRQVLLRGIRLDGSATMSSLQKMTVSVHARSITAAASLGSPSCAVSTRVRPCLARCVASTWCRCPSLWPRVRRAHECKPPWPAAGPSCPPRRRPFPLHLTPPREGDDQL